MIEKEFENMNIQLIRNATLVVQYAEKKFLIDPFLAEKGDVSTLPKFIKTRSE
jgi:L-ascorbate metabolism protein UlaG (beta-lactamase superfamily)